MKWTAKTESGACYEYDNGFLRVFKHGRHWASYKPTKCVTIPEEVFDQWRTLGVIDWEWIKEATSVKIAEIGSHLYVGALNEWRISTRIISVEVLEEESEDEQ